MNELHHFLRTDSGVRQPNVPRADADVRPRHVPNAGADVQTPCPSAPCRDPQAEAQSLNVQHDKDLIFAHSQLFTLGVINCQSYKSKTDIINRYIRKLNFECVALTETWLTEGDQVELSGYDFISVPRPGGKRRGGVGVLCKKQYRMTQNQIIPKKSFECMSVDIRATSCTFRIIVIYRPPLSKQNDFNEDFGILLEAEAKQLDKLLVTGDFNIRKKKPGATKRSKFAEILDAFELKQHVSGPTHILGNTLDFLLSCSTDDTVHSCTVSEKPVSDHHALHVELKYEKAS